MLSNRFFFAGVITFVAVTALATPITTPSGLNFGDQYRLAFVTSQTTLAQSTSIAYYDAFVTSVANTIPELANLSTTWHVIGSTPRRVQIFICS